MPRTNCCVPLCHATSIRHTKLSFYRLPKDEKVRKNWVSLIRNSNLDVSSTSSRCVCSLHFRGGRKTYDVNVPTIFPWSSDWESVVERYNDDVRQSGDHSYTATTKQSKLLTLNKPKHASKTVRPRQTLNSSLHDEPEEPTHAIGAPVSTCTKCFFISLWSYYNCHIELCNINSFYKQNYLVRISRIYM